MIKICKQPLVPNKWNVIKQRNKIKKIAEKALHSCMRFIPGIQTGDPWIAWKLGIK